MTIGIVVGKCVSYSIEVLWQKSVCPLPLGPIKGLILVTFHWAVTPTCYFTAGKQTSQKSKSHYNVIILKN
jgi:hypothetical protein